MFPCAPETLRQFLNQLADQAGKITTDYFYSQLNVLDKADSSPVTEGDRATERALRAAINAEFPDHGIIGEEFGKSHEEADYQWVLDPIDGTRSFITGRPLYTTLIALLYKGTPIAGLIDQPVTKDRWIGLKGVEASHNGQAMRCSSQTDLAKARGAATAPQMFTGNEQQAELRLRTEACDVLYGGDAFNYGLVAQGKLDFVFESQMSQWDYAALIPVIEAAGGLVTDWQGKPLTTVKNAQVLAAANKELHQQLLDRLAVAAHK